MSLTDLAIKAKLNRIPLVRPLYYRLWHVPQFRLFDTATIDVSSACNMACVYCLHQNQKLTRPRLMDWETYERIIEILSAEGFTNINLYFTGEPFLNPLLPRMIKKAAENKMDVVVATKLNCPIRFLDFSPEHDGLTHAVFSCAQNLTHITFQITIDSLERPEMMAPGANKALIRANLEQIAKYLYQYDTPSEADKQAGGKLLESYKSQAVRFQLQTIVTRANENELEAIREYLATLDLAEYWKPLPMAWYTPWQATEAATRRAMDFLPENPKYRTRFDVVDGKPVSHIKSCNYLSPAIGPTGNVTICCHDMQYQINAGNVLESGSLRKIVASDIYVQLARKGRRMELGICEGCN